MESVDPMVKIKIVLVKVENFIVIHTSNKITQLVFIGWPIHQVLDHSLSKKYFGDGLVETGIYQPTVGFLLKAIHVLKDRDFHVFVLRDCSQVKLGVDEISFMKETRRLRCGPKHYPTVLSTTYRPWKLNHKVFRYRVMFLFLVIVDVFVINTH